MTPPIRPLLLYVITEDWFFCSHFLPMARAARAMEMDVTIAARRSNHAARLVAEGFSVIDLDLDRGGVNPFRATASIIKLAWLYQRLQPAIIHHIALKPVVFGALAARLARKRAVINAVTGFGYLFTHQDPRLKPLQTMVRGLLRVTLGRKDSITLMENHDDANTLVKESIVQKNQIVIVPGAGVNPDDWPALPLPRSDDDVVLTIGLAARMLWSKGIDLAVAAIEQLRAKGVHVRLLLAGTPDPENPGAIPLEKLQEWDRQPGIRWLGRLERIQELWTQCDIALLPSRGGEGLPRSLIEAAACGRPLITADVPGCREIVRNGDNGIVVPSNDATAIANAIQWMIDNPEQRQTMGATSRQIFEQGFTEQIVIDTIQKLYRDRLIADGWTYQP
jgi:glycosyltransferase involved in cell wall biosynthesis